jgi:hypothetical protein
MRRTIRMVALSMVGAAMTLSAVVLTPRLAGSSEVRSVTLYTDPASGQVFTKRCKRCVRLGEYVPAGSTQEIERKVERHTQQQLDQERAAMEAEEAQRQAQQQQWNAEMAKQVGEIQPYAQEFGDRWYKKISLGTLIYGDYGYFSHAGFGPQFLTQQNWPGPGNNSFSAFNITRAYIDLKFTPVDDFSARVTPNIYASVNTGTTCTATSTSKSTSTGGVKTTTTTTTACVASSGDKVGGSSGFAQSVDGNLNYRLKYAYIDYNTFFKKILKFAPMAEDKFTFGQQQNPLVDWEENLWGFRYTALTPWNYLSLSSTQVGVAMKGPIKINEKQYADYDVGVYDDASFHAIEQSAYKQVMGRITVNPFGANSRYDGLGLTGFYDYGYSNKCTPDSNASNATCGHIARAAGIAHYTAATWGIIGEWDYGHNAFNAGNLYSGSGPSDAIGIASAKNRDGLNFGPWNTMVGQILNTQAVQMGADLMGHWDIPHTPFTAFGLLQWFQPNTRINKDPLDFTRYDLGVQWLINKYVRIAFDSQAIQYYHSQFTFPATKVPGQKPTPDVLFAVPRDTHAFFLNLEFRY